MHFPDDLMKQLSEEERKELAAAMEYADETGNRLPLVCVIEDIIHTHHLLDLQDS